MLRGLGAVRRGRLGQIDWGDETIFPPDDGGEGAGAGSGITGGSGTGQPPPGFVGPGAVPVVLHAWDVESTPARYQLQYGDTLAGLAATYLGDGTRWREIWNVQSANFRATRSPDTLYASEWIAMPNEARDNLKKWIDTGEPPGTTPGQIATQDRVDALRGGKIPWGTVGLVAGAAALGGGLIWALS